VTVQVVDRDVSNIIGNPVNLASEIAQEVQELSERAGVPNIQVVQSNITSIGKLFSLIASSW